MSGSFSLLQAAASDKFIVVGASTGGPGILRRIFQVLPPETSGIVVVQHLCEGFSGQLAAYLNQYCRMKVKEAARQEVICDGQIYIAPFGRHLKVGKGKEGYYLKQEAGKKENGVCPSIDALFSSASCGGRDVLGILLTGMGKDGAAGLLELYRKGAWTIVQDKATSAIYSMPLEAKKIGGVKEELSPEQIVDRILKFSGKRRRDE